MFGEPWGWSFKTVKCYMGKYIYICSLSTWFLLAPINLFYIHGDSIQVYGKGGPSWSYNINHSNDIPNRAAAVLNWNSAGYVQHTGSQANLAKAQGYVDRQEGIRGKVNQSGTRYIYIYTSWAAQFFPMNDISLESCFGSSECIYVIIPAHDGMHKPNLSGIRCACYRSHCDPFSGGLCYTYIRKLPKERNPNHETMVIIYIYIECWSFVCIYKRLSIMAIRSLLSERSLGNLHTSKRNYPKVILHTCNRNPSGIPFNVSFNHSG